MCRQSMHTKWTAPSRETLAAAPRVSARNERNSTSLIRPRPSRIRDDVRQTPHARRSARALKAYAPVGVKFWENQETALEGLKEFAEGWFARRHKGMQAALETAKHIGDAETPSDILREYQDWVTREMELLAEDGKAYQQQVLRAGAQLSAPPEAPQVDERRTG